MAKTDYWEQIEEAFEEVDIYEGFTEYTESAEKYPKWKIELLAVHSAMREIANGGLRQFFLNSTGILAPEAVQGFRNVGQDQLADLLEKAMEILSKGEEYRRDRKVRNERLGVEIGDEDEEEEDFSFIPKFVLNMTEQEEEEEDDPFVEFEDPFFEAQDFLEDVLDEYAGKHCDPN